MGLLFSFLLLKIPSYATTHFQRKPCGKFPGKQWKPEMVSPETTTVCLFILAKKKHLIYSHKIR
jgi:hypothetical protein